MSTARVLAASRHMNAATKAAVKEKQLERIRAQQDALKEEEQVATLRSRTKQTRSLGLAEAGVAVLGGAAAAAAQRPLARRATDMADAQSTQTMISEDPFHPVAFDATWHCKVTTSRSLIADQLLPYHNDVVVDDAMGIILNNTCGEPCDYNFTRSDHEVSFVPLTTHDNRVVSLVTVQCKSDPFTTNAGPLYTNLTNCVSGAAENAKQLLLAGKSAAALAAAEAAKRAAAQAQSHVHAEESHIGLGVGLGVAAGAVLVGSYMAYRKGYCHKVSEFLSSCSSRLFGNRYSRLPESYDPNAAMHEDDGLVARTTNNRPGSKTSAY